MHRHLLSFPGQLFNFLLHALKEVYSLSRMEGIGFVNTLDGVPHRWEEVLDVVRHVVVDGYHLDGAGAALGTESRILVVLVGTRCTNDMSAARKEEGGHDIDRFEVLRLHHATHAMKPIHDD